MGMAGMTAAQHEEKQAAKVIAARDIVEKLDGKEAKVSFVEVTVRGRSAGKPHRHPGPVFGYVLEGEFVLGETLALNHRSACKCASTNQSHLSMAREISVKRSAVSRSPISLAASIAFRTDLPNTAN